ncbi:hypothetical protein Taro_050960 [Colocasia esculenta]|uniref:Uncharacterized protein n=1 Tax=Colocasia esculenta TaxID=4460 RepID=A0A843XFP6_COLES|nr:hypothetical protein [Colocasia esculenta]
MVAPLLPHVFDFASSAGVVFGLTQSSFAYTLLEFMLLWLRLAVAGVRCRTVVVASCLPGVASSVSCERECSLYCKLRLAFLQVLGLFEFIAYLTRLNSNPSGSSDLWVGVRPLGSLAGGPGGRVVTTMMVEYFIRGLPAELQDAVIPLMCKTVEEAA